MSSGWQSRMVGGSRELPSAQPSLGSLIVFQQGGIEVDIDAADQRLKSVDEAGIYRLQPVGMASDVGRQEV